MLFLFIWGKVNGKIGTEEVNGELCRHARSKGRWKDVPPFLDILVLTVCAVLCGADDWEAVEMWGEAKLEWLRQYIPLKNGIPSDDTTGRLFATMNSTTCQACCTRWVPTICGSLVGQVVAIDGKTMRALSEG
ncbi:MAG: ISAs1 family transposase [Glaciimonas sp.]|nr:ISAs1 family transposase [Glaciimonas sp.]